VGQFEQLPQLQTPHRWRNKNEALGGWLVGVRQRLEAGDPIDIQRRPNGVHWFPADPSTQRDICFKRAHLSGTVAAIHAGDLEGPCQFLARRLGGRYQSMEPVDCEALYSWAAKIEAATGGERAARLVDFAGVCLAGVKGELTTIRRRLLKGTGKRGTPLRKHPEVLAALEEVAASKSLAPTVAALEAVCCIGGTKMFRRELWESLGQALKEIESGQSPSLVDAAWAVRDRVRRYGRRAEPRTVSRTLLVKGLEYDHAIVLDADKLDKKQLYVALTRGCRSLTVLSAQSLLRPK
jgi:hypothetical protein